MKPRIRKYGQRWHVRACLMSDEAMAIRFCHDLNIANFVWSQQPFVAGGYGRRGEGISLVAARLSEGKSLFGMDLGEGFSIASGPTLEEVRRRVRECLGWAGDIPHLH